MTRTHERSWTHDRTHWDWYGERTSTAYSRTAWAAPDAPWHNEPDKVQWIDLATGFDGLAKRNHVGAWCGYVGVPPGHRYHGVNYMDVDVSVHGGLTYSEFCNEAADEAHGICHVPEPGRPANVWWLGFDCAHGMDVAPRTPLMTLLPSPSPIWGTPEYRTLAYVQEEVRQLAAQLAPKQLTGGSP